MNKARNTTNTKRKRFAKFSESLEQEGTFSSRLLSSNQPQLSSKNPFSGFTPFNSRLMESEVVEQDKSKEEEGGLINKLSARMAMLRTETKPKTCFSVFSREHSGAEDEQLQSSLRLKRDKLSTTTSTVLLKKPPNYQRNKFFSAQEVQRKRFKKHHTVGGGHSARPGDLRSDSILSNNQVRRKMLAFSKNLSTNYKKDDPHIGDSVETLDKSGRSDASRDTEHIPEYGEESEQFCSVFTSMTQNVQKLVLPMILEGFEGDSVCESMQDGDKNYKNSRLEGGGIKRIFKPKCQKIEFVSHQSWPSIEEQSYQPDELTFSRESNLDYDSVLGEPRNSVLLDKLPQEMLENVHKTVEYCITNKVDVVDFDDLVKIFYPNKQTKLNFGEYVELKKIEAVLEKISENSSIEVDMMNQSSHIDIANH